MKQFPQYQGRGPVLCKTVFFFPNETAGVCVRVCVYERLTKHSDEFHTLFKCYI